MKPALIFQNYYTPARDALFRKMVEQGQVLTVLYMHLPSDEGRRWSEPTDLPYTSVQMPHFAFGPVILFWVPFAFWRWRGPVIATDNNPTNIAMLLWCFAFRAFGCRIGMWIEHIPDAYKGSAKLAYQTTCTRVLCALSHRILAFSAMTIRYLQDIAPTAKIDRMVQATPMDGPFAPPRPTRGLRRFGYLGSADERKNVAALRQAFAMLDDPTVQLHLAGFEQQDDAPRTHWYGYIDGSAREDFFAAIDILVLPSLADPWGFVVNEALARGALAIVTNRCGSAELVEKVDPALVCDVTPASIAAALRHAISLDSYTVEQIHLRAREAMDAYGMDAAVARIIHHAEAVDAR